MGGKNQFKDSWLRNDSYKSCLEQKSMYIGRCKACCKDAIVENMEESASKNHAKPGSKYDFQIQGIKQGNNSLSMLHYIQKFPEQTSVHLQIVQKLKGLSFLFQLKLLRLDGL